MTRGWFTHHLLKVAAAAALVRLGHPDGEAALGRLLRARRRDTRGFAMEQIGELGLHAFTEALGESLRDPKSYHADTAALALGRLASPRARALLLAAADDPREPVRAEVARALAH
jgi:HEAT repeat protein